MFGEGGINLACNANVFPFVNSNFAETEQYTSFGMCIYLNFIMLFAMYRYTLNFAQKFMYFENNVNMHHIG